ncbi:fibronectin type III domain-containing protein [Aquimarina sp. 2201CG1-2-11]|uniref:fibronectin type III domain-containing protein n=1 Tax=Aquimarina discodermiae TaxID=3231043 RepID=UPI003461D741
MILKYSTFSYIIATLLFTSIPTIAQDFVLKPYLQNNAQDRIVIMWEVKRSGQCFVDWGTNPFSLNNTTSSISIASRGINRIHTAKITGLQPNTKYYYKVRTSSGALSSLYNFRTHPSAASEESLKFVAMSDMQRDSNNPNVFKSIVEQGVSVVANNSYPNGIEDLDAILIPGDLVVQSTHSSWKNEFFDPSNAITPYLPVYPAPGNHDVLGSGGLGLFLKYFDLPRNGSSSNPEEWWYKDISNVRLIGLNSNASSSNKQQQINWLKQVLQNAGIISTIDFVFVQLHHPHKSELWTPGESDFSGDVVAELETFTSNYEKPSIHFFGHTHGYSRGQSRDHNHVWMNVATAGGNIDYWGEFANADYDEFTYTEDEYGFVMLEVEAGNDPKFKLKRYSRGDENVTKNNTLSDEITIKRYDIAPSTPTGISPIGKTPINCITLKASPFSHPNSTHQATHWQIVEGCDFSSTNIRDIWKQFYNWYNEIDTQKNDDLTDEKVNDLIANKTYCWRVRYRNTNLTWSQWSDPISITTAPDNDAITGNLLLNSGAESGTSNWTGDIEAIPSNGCNSIPSHMGAHHFAVGGVCANEQATGIAKQTIDLSSYTTEIETTGIALKYTAYLRSYNGTDQPEMYIEFLGNDNQMIEQSPSLINKTPQWKNIAKTIPIPSGTKSLSVILEGTRNGGTDNDSYFDTLHVSLSRSNSCSITSCLDGIKNGDETGIDCGGSSCHPCLPCEVSNLLINGNAENGTNNWSGDIESLISNECFAVPSYQGQRLFAVGGVCTNEKTVGIARQSIDVSSYTEGINNNLFTAELSGFLRSYRDGNDKPEMYLEFINANNTLIKTSTPISNTSATWQKLTDRITIPTGTKVINVVLKGNRLIGTDNDSYYDALSLTLQNSTCSKAQQKIATERYEENKIIIPSKSNIIKLHPNPSAGVVYYNSSININTIKIYDTNGRQLIQKKSLFKNGSINLSGLENGTYIILFSGSKASVSQKLILLK